MVGRTTNIIMSFLGAPGPRPSAPRTVVFTTGVAGLGMPTAAPAAPVTPGEGFKELRSALDEQEAEITAKIERMEERILQADARNQKDSNPVQSVFASLARDSVWSSS